MSEICLAFIMAFDRDAFVQASEAWKAMAQDFDDATETYYRDGMDLPHVWPEGTDAEAAEKGYRKLRTRIGNAADPAKRIGAALRSMADGISGLRETTLQIVQEAEKHGYTIDFDNATVGIGGDPGPGASRAQTASSLAGQLNSIVERARSLDSDTIRAINENTPADAQYGFGDQAGKSLSKEDVAKQKGRDPKQVRQWWENLTPQQQEDAIHDFPELVGWLDGVPADDRDAANRFRLDNDLNRLKGDAARIRQQLDDFEHGRSTDLTYHDIPKLQEQLKQTETTIDSLDTVKRKLEDLGKQGLQGFLLGIDPSGDGKAIVAIGNPDQATNIATYVPGTGARVSAESGFCGHFNRTTDMASDAAIMAPEQRTSVVLWLGYDAPDGLTNATSGDYADAAAGDLRRFQGGLRASHGPGEATQTVLGHSYGTTVIGHAARGGHSLDADQVIFVASPGVGVDHADDLSLRNGDTSGTHVWSTIADDDPVFVGSVRHGQNPAGPSFGGNVFPSAHGGDNAHSSYWREHNPARENMVGLIVGGH